MFNKSYEREVYRKARSIITEKHYPYPDETPLLRLLRDVYHDARTHQRAYVRSLDRLIQNMTIVNPKRRSGFFEKDHDIPNRLMDVLNRLQKEVENEFSL